jgi:hypothetical protein
MPRPHGRHCRRCYVRIPRRSRICPVCRALNPKLVDYVLAGALLATMVVWRLL